MLHEVPSEFVEKLKEISGSRLRSEKKFSLFLEGNDISKNIFKVTSEFEYVNKKA